MSLAVFFPPAAWATPLSKNEIAILRERDVRYPAAPPSEFAMLLAAKIGREGNIDGLREIISLRDASLLNRAVSSYDSGSSRQLPEALETLVVEHYADPLLQGPLLGLLARNIDKRERYPKYRSRKLFDLLYAGLKGSEQFRNAIRIVATDLKDIERELVATLPTLAPASANELVMFLGTRKFAAATPALLELQAKTPYERNDNQLLEHINWALLQIGTPESVQAVLERMNALGRKSADRRAGNEVWTILLGLTDLPAGSPPDYPAIRAALPAELTESGWTSLVKLIVSRKEKRGIPDLILALAQASATDDAANALLAMGEPEDWRTARTELGRMSGGSSKPERLVALQKRFDDALADPAKFMAKRRQTGREQELQKDEARFREEKNRLAAIRATDPQRYADELRVLIGRQEALLREYADLPYSTGARQALWREYAGLAAFLRFTLRKPDEAIAAYQALAKLQPAGGLLDLASLGVADTLRFDKRDAKKAIDHYRVFLASVSDDPARPNARQMPLAGLRRWIEHEIDYLERGKPFSGVIGREDLSVLQSLMIVGAMHQQTDPALYAAMNWMNEATLRGENPPKAASDLLRAIDALPPSQFHVAGAFMAVLQLPSREILRFFAKHDPAGYLTAAILALATYWPPQSAVAGGGLFNPYAGAPGSSAAVKAAAETFFRARGIHAALEPNPRYASAEKTWALFLDSAKKGDAAAMLACFTPGMRSKLQELFTRMSREELRKMAESFVAFSMKEATGQYREAVIVRQSGDKKQAGFVYFVNEGGDWKIESM